MPLKGLNQPAGEPEEKSCQAHHAKEKEAGRLLQLYDKNYKFILILHGLC